MSKFGQTAEEGADNSPYVFEEEGGASSQQAMGQPQRGGEAKFRKHGGGEGRRQSLAKFRKPVSRYHFGGMDHLANSHENYPPPQNNPDNREKRNMSVANSIKSNQIASEPRKLFFSTKIIVCGKNDCTDVNATEAMCMRENGKNVADGGGRGWDEIFDT